MLAYILAIAVAIASFGFYIGAFFFPEIHRKEDFYWSGVGLFYALVLWVCAGRITGGVLLGQAASVALLGWFGWQTITLRRELTPAAQRTEVPSQAEVQEKVEKLGILGRITGFFSSITGFITKLTQRQNKPETKLTQPTTTITELKTSPTGEPSRPIVEVIDSTTTNVEVVNTTTTDIDGEDFEDIEDTETEEPVRPHPPAPELVEAAIEDAEAKHIPADPPATEPETVETEVVSPETQVKNSSEQN